MAETKQERRESWKQRTGESAAALKKAGATISRGGRRSVPLSAQTPAEIRVAAFRAEHPERIIVDPSTGKHTRVSTTPRELGVTEPIRSLTNIGDIYRGPGTGPGVTDYFKDYVSRMSSQMTAERLAQAQQQSFESRLGSPAPPVETEAGRALRDITEPVVEEIEAEIKAKPDKMVLTDEPEYVPSPYVPGTLPEDVEYGERPQFDQPQAHDIFLQKLRELDTLIGERRREMDTMLSSRIPDIDEGRSTYIATQIHAFTGRKQMPYLPEEDSTEDIQNISRFIEGKYTQFQQTPLTTVRDIGTEAAIIILTGGVAGLGIKSGIIGARAVTRYGAGKIATRIPPVPVTLGPRTAKIHTLAEKLWSGRVLKDPEKFDIGKFASSAIQTTPGLIEPAVALGFTAHMYKDIKSTTKEEIPRKIYEYGLGFLGATKGFKAPEKFIGWWSTKGRKEIPLETIVEPSVLAGKRYLPDLKKGETFEEYALRFQYEKLPSEIAPKIITKEMMKAPMEEQIHYRGFRAVSERTRDIERISTTQKQFPIKPRHETDMPVTYVSADTLSPYFLMLGGKVPGSRPTLKSLLSTTQSPFAKAYRIEAKGVRRLPKEVREDVGMSQKFMEEQAEPGFFYTTKALERKFSGAPGGKKEIEAGLTGETLYKTTGETYYITHRGVRVPLNEINARINQKQANINQEIVSTKGKYIKESELKSYDLLTSSKKYVPIIKGSDYTTTAVQEYVPPPASKEYRPPPPTREYVPPSQPKEYVPPPQPKEYVSPPQPKEYVPPPPPMEYVPPPPPMEYVPPPPPMEYVPPPPPGYKKDLIRKGKIMTPGYAWNLANPIASLEQLMGGRTTKRTTRKARRTSKSRRKTTRR